MQEILCEFFKKLRSNRELMFSITMTFIWGIIAHGYVFLHSSFTHDSLNEFNAAVFGNAWKIQLGRIFVPVYRAVTRTSMTFPWLIGLISLLWISLAVFFVIKLFRIRLGIIICLTSGIFVTNLTIVATAATYIHDLDSNMFALLMAVIAAFLWDKYKRGFLGGIFFVTVSLGLYQSYVSVAITLLLMVLIIELLNQKSFSRVFEKGMKGILMLSCGGALYLLMIKVVHYICHISLISGKYNSLDNAKLLSISELLGNIIESYSKTIQIFLTAPMSYPKSFVEAVNIFIVAIVCMLIFYQLWKRKIPIKERLLAILLTALLPLGMNISYILAGGMSHDLMHFALWLAYLLVLLLGCGGRYVEAENKFWKFTNYGIVFLIFIILWGNVQTANAAYLKKNLEQEANLALFTRILYRMEEHEEYAVGVTPVVFVGEPSQMQKRIPGFEYCYKMIGSQYTYVLGAASKNFYQAYFDYILQTPVMIADSEIWDKVKENILVKEMPCYPEKDCMQMINDIFVVKLGEPDI